MDVAHWLRARWRRQLAGGRCTDLALAAFCSIRWLHKSGPLMPPPSTNLAAFVRSLVLHRELLWRLAGRDVSSRFRGSALGLTWAALTPLLMATIFTWVFAGVLQSRWGGSGGPLDFALSVMTGLVVHGIFAEAVGRAPQLILAHSNYVTKVIFPLEILPVVSTLATLVNAGITASLVLLGNLLLRGDFHPTALFLPIILIPFLVFVVALSLFLSAAGIFLRDLQQVTALVVTITLFLSPIFYPLSAVPPTFRALMRLNPLTPVIEQSRTVLVHGGWPDFTSLGLYGLCALAALAVAFWIFQRLRPGFADVL